MKVQIPKRLHPFLSGLLRRGLHGNTEAEVVVRLVEEALRRLIADEYLQKLEQALAALKRER